MNYAEGCRILYFDTGAGNNALLESASYPTNAFRGLEPKDATHVNLYFESAKGCNAVDTVELKIVSGTHTDVIVSITNVIADQKHPIDGATDFQTTIFDGTSGFKINNNILDCIIIQGTACAGGSSGDTYTLEASAKTGSNVPLLLNAASGSDSTVNLTEGTNITLTRNSQTQVTIDASVPNVYHQINNHNLSIESWNLRDVYLFPIVEESGKGFYTGKPVGTLTTPSAYSTLNAFKFQNNLERATAAWDKISWYNISMANATAAAIASIGAGAQLKLVLYRYTPSAGDTSFNYTTQILGNIAFNAGANKVQISAQTNSITLSIGDLFFLGYEFTVTSGKITGTITNLALQTTGRFWKA